MKVIKSESTIYRDILTYQVEENEDYEDVLTELKQRVNDSCFGGFVSRSNHNQIVVTYEKG